MSALELGVQAIAQRRLDESAQREVKWRTRQESRRVAARFEQLAV